MRDCLQFNHLVVHIRVNKFFLLLKQIEDIPILTMVCHRIFAHQEDAMQDVPSRPGVNEVCFPHTFSKMTPIHILQDSDVSCSMPVTKQCLWFKTKLARNNRKWLKQKLLDYPLALHHHKYNIRVQWRAVHLTNRISCTRMLWVWWLAITKRLRIFIRSEMYIWMSTNTLVLIHQHPFLLSCH